MSIFRLTDADQLESMQLSPAIEAQLKAALASAPARRLPGHLEGTEEGAGRQLVAWIDALHYGHATLGRVCVGDYFAHVANGGGRTRAEGGAFKAQGVRAGWPDYILDLPVGRFHGMRLELKRDDGAKPTPEQLDILARLEKAGYYCAVAWGFDEAKRSINRYLGAA